MFDQTINIEDISTPDTWKFVNNKSVEANLQKANRSWYTTRREWILQRLVCCFSSLAAWLCSVLKVIFSSILYIGSVSLFLFVSINALNFCWFSSQIVQWYIKLKKKICAKILCLLTPYMPYDGKTIICLLKYIRPTDFTQKARF